jgi:hypothetical protein
MFSDWNFLIYTIRAACPAHLILDFITLIFGEEYRLDKSQVIFLFRVMQVRRDLEWIWTHMNLFFLLRLFI